MYQDGTSSELARHAADVLVAHVHATCSEEASEIAYGIYAADLDSTTNNSDRRACVIDRVRGTLPRHVRIGKRVLLVDDNEDARRAPRRLLELQGFRVQAAGDATAALALAEQFKPEGWCSISGARGGWLGAGPGMR